LNRKQAVTIKILLFADTHLGFDYPTRTFVEKRRRGPDFFESYDRVLSYAESHAVDLVIHGGDLFFRSLVPDAIVSRAYQRLHEFALSRIPLYIVPGNHERSRLPPSLFVSHPEIHIFHSASTFHENVKGAAISISGFPSFRGKIRFEFPLIAAKLEEEASGADIRLLCMHEVVEGTRVGPSDYTFRTGDNVISRRDIPAGFDAILSGHIHRAQILRFNGKTGAGSEAIPVIYPGSTERTSFAEKDEAKGFYLISFEKSADRWSIASTEFVELETRPMISLTVPERTWNQETLLAEIGAMLEPLDRDAIVRIALPDEASVRLVTSPLLRSIAPPSMNIEIAVSRPRERPERKKTGRLTEKLPEAPGVYLFLDGAGRVVYVGKSMNLKSRVQSYFSASQFEKRFHRKPSFQEVRIHRTATELLALLLEDRLIKKYMPELNTKQKEFSGYHYLAFTGDPFPALLAVESPDDCPEGELFGPFGDRFFNRDLREMICDLFGIRFCRSHEPDDRCARHGTGLCSGACFGHLPTQSYRILVDRVRTFLQGDPSWPKSVLKDRMNAASDALEFESAAYYRELLSFVKGFCERQQFISRFSEEGLVITEKGGCGFTYLFSHGTLLKVFRHQLVGDEALQVFRNAVPGRSAEPPGYVLDRAMVVYRYIKRFDVETEHCFVPLPIITSD